jgi:hypothetical protein
MLNPLDTMKNVMLSAGFEYVTNCQDDTYKILAFQKNAKSTKATGLQAITDKLSGSGSGSGGSGVGDLTKNLDLGSLLSGVGAKAKSKELKEVLNFKSLYNDERGMLLPQEITFLHVQDGSQQWFGSFDKASSTSSCIRMCQDTGSVVVCNEKDGITALNKTSNTLNTIADKDRSLLSWFRPDLARTIVPNKIIKMKALCFGAAHQKMITISSDGEIILEPLGSGSDQVQCIKNKLTVINPNKPAGNDLTPIMGPVDAVYTDQASIVAGDGIIDSVRTKDSAGATVPDTGQEVQSPSEEVQRDIASGTFSPGPTFASSNRIEVNCDAKVNQIGYASVAPHSSSTTPLGELRTITTKFGRIEYDPKNQELLVSLYVLDEISVPQVVKGIDTDVGTKGIKISDVAAQPGMDAQARAFKDLIDKLQGTAGFQVFDTKDKTYYLTDDGKLKIFDKKTGEITEAKITGPITKNADGTITVPTDKGDYQFKIDSQNGQPMITVNNPDGSQELAALLAAKGLGGILVFDPKTGTWKAFNGQDIPWDQQFAEKGLAYMGSDGKGVPMDNPYANRRTGSGTTGGDNALLSLPGFPEDETAKGAMIALVLLGVLAARRSGKTDGSKRKKKS